MKIREDNLFDAYQFEITKDISNIDNVLDYEQVLLSISKRIIKYRTENNLTQTQLANILGIKQEMISKLERGNYNPTMKLLFNISTKLTKTPELFVNMLKDIITSLYKSKNIGYTIKFEKYETYKYNINCNKKDNITYLVKQYNNEGGTSYGEITNTSRFAING